jgi:hypothetical protein
MKKRKKKKESQGSRRLIEFVNLGLCICQIKGQNLVKGFQLFSWGRSLVWLVGWLWHVI